MIWVLISRYSVYFNNSFPCELATGLTVYCAHWHKRSGVVRSVKNKQGRGIDVYIIWQVYINWFTVIKNYFTSVNIRQVTQPVYHKPGNKYRTLHRYSHREIKNENKHHAKKWLFKLSIIYLGILFRTSRCGWVGRWHLRKPGMSNSSYRLSAHLGKWLATWTVNTTTTKQPEEQWWTWNFFLDPNCDLI